MLDHVSELYSIAKNDVVGAVYYAYNLVSQNIVTRIKTDKTQKAKPQNLEGIAAHYAR